MAWIYKQIKIYQMKNIKLYEQFINEAAVPAGHAGLEQIFNGLKSFGFTFDKEGKLYGGIPTIIKGDDDNGAVVQYKRKTQPERPNDVFTVLVTVGGKEKLNKSYPLTSQDFLAPEKVVQTALKDLEPWKKYNFPKSSYAG